MHRHLLEEDLENLREQTGVEFKFVRSSPDTGDMDFFRGPQPQDDGGEGDAVASPSRQVVPVFVPGSSFTGERDYRVTAASQGTGPVITPAVQKR